MDGEWKEEVDEERLAEAQSIEAPPVKKANQAPRDDDLSHVEAFAALLASKLQDDLEAASAPGSLGRLYLGDRDAAGDEGVLEALGIRSVVNATLDTPNFFEGRLKYFCVDVDDSPEEDLLSYIDGCVEFIQHALAAGENVLVHCRWGVSLGELGHCVAELPNEGFVAQLHKLEERLRDKELPREFLAQEAIATGSAKVRASQPDAPVHMDPKVKRLMREIAVSEGLRQEVVMDPAFVADIKRKHKVDHVTSIFTDPRLPADDCSTYTLKHQFEGHLAGDSGVSLMFCF
ncbi:dusp1-b [Symbiodinium pilosum]|uniref:Dusp1-b protein n=1 Tax=Symbiodinium pilosum TaxID=2952 RepID=A0A812MIA6_SYMPI|nr:dusp1-b [Symbiodinium pilosum]